MGTTFMTREIDGETFVYASAVGPLLNEIEDLRQKISQQEKEKERLEELLLDFWTIQGKMLPGSSDYLEYVFSMGQVARELYDCINTLDGIIRDEN